MDTDFNFQGYCWIFCHEDNVLLIWRSYSTKSVQILFFFWIYELDVLVLYLAEELLTFTGPWQACILLSSAANCSKFQKTRSISLCSTHPSLITGLGWSLGLKVFGLRKYTHFPSHVTLRFNVRLPSSSEFFSEDN